ncbi:cytochrome P450 76A2-like [Papaver somniferum]|uniref:cytochrome P450 76A2-like n=1 Tax=Papaver somniferum TaxID=3469 RepID=UPI000E6F5431|nr:cytochrome P450 76A2-like [Papaver somniferum]
MKDPVSTNLFVCAAISVAVAALLLLLLLHNFLILKNKTNSRRLPPGPPCWPLIGNRLNVGYDCKVPHKRLVEIQMKYGPIFMMRMGALNTLVIASADAAMELLKTHHQAFINRHLVQRLQPVDDKKFKATAWAPYGGPIWRISRRLYATLFSRTTMNNTVGKRRQLVDQMIQWISVEEKEGRSVEIKHLTLVAFVNLLGNLFFSKYVMDLKSATGSELYQLLGEIVQLSSKLNVADLFPWLRNLDSQNMANRMKKALYAFENIVDGLAKERKRMHVVRNNNEEKDYWDLLMDFEGNGKDEPIKLSDRYIISFITVSKFINLNN